jgi:photosystem II stability/assembly factor-like uncharacterized protein
MICINPCSAAALAGAGVYQLENGSTEWKGRNDGLENLNMIAIAVDPHEPSNVFIAGHAGVFLSRDNGSSWHKLVEGFENLQSINALVFSPDAKILFAGENAGLYGLLVH